MIEYVDCHERGATSPIWLQIFTEYLLLGENDDGRCQVADGVLAVGLRPKGYLHALKWGSGAVSSLRALPL